MEIELTLYTIMIIGIGNENGKMWNEFCKRRITYGIARHSFTHTRTRFIRCCYSYIKFIDFLFFSFLCTAHSLTGCIVQFICSTLTIHCAVTHNRKREQKPIRKVILSYNLQWQYKTLRPRPLSRLGMTKFHAKKKKKKKKTNIFQTAYKFDYGDNEMIIIMIMTRFLNQQKRAQKKAEKDENAVKKRRKQLA